MSERYECTCSNLPAGSMNHDGGCPFWDYVWDHGEWPRTGSSNTVSTEDVVKGERPKKVHLAFDKSHEIRVDFDPTKDEVTPWAQNLLRVHEENQKSFLQSPEKTAQEERDAEEKRRAFLERYDNDPSYCHCTEFNEAGYLVHVKDCPQPWSYHKNMFKKTAQEERDAESVEAVKQRLLRLVDASEAERRANEERGGSYDNKAFLELCDTVNKIIRERDVSSRSEEVSMALERNRRHLAREEKFIRDTKAKYPRALRWGRIALVIAILWAAFFYGVWRVTKAPRRARAVETVNFDGFESR